MRITKSIHKYEHKLDAKTEHFIFHHPVLGFFTVFVGIPLLVLLCVCVCTIAIVFPLAWVLGWL